MKRMAAIGIVALAMTAGSATAEACSVIRDLRADRKSLDTNVSVSKRDRAFIESFGLQLDAGGFGATYVRRDALLAALTASNCHPDLARWITRKARYPRADR